MDLGLKGKVAIVTAASQGLGKASALALAAEGARVAVCSRREREIRLTADELSSSTGNPVLPVQADVLQAADLERLVSVVREQLGPVNVLVNNAGGPPAGDILDLTDDQWHHGYDLLVMSVIRLTRHVLPAMLSAGWGRILTITSYAAKEPITDLLVSSTLRPGLLGLMRALSNKYAGRGITFNTICPGNILTNRQVELMHARAASGKVTPEEYQSKIASAIPAGRLGRPEEIGSAVAYLASEQASYISGVNLLVDGGLSRAIH